MVWFAVDEELDQMIKDSLMTSDTLEGIWYKRRDGKDKYWIDLKEFHQQNCNKTHGGRKRWLRMVQRVVVWADPADVIADQRDENGVKVPYSDFNWQSESNSGLENMPHPMNVKMLALVDNSDLANGIHECTHTWKNPATNRVMQTVYSIDLDNLIQTNPNSEKQRRTRMVYDVSVREGGPQHKLPDYPDFGNQPSDSKAIDSKAIDSQPSGPDEAHSEYPPKDSWAKQSDSWNTKGWKGWSQACSSNEKERDVWDGYAKPSTQGSKHDDQGSRPAHSWSHSSGSWKEPPRPHQ